VVYPNPSQGKAVQLSRVISGTLHDLAGRAVRQLAATTQFDTNGLAPGVYVLRATDGATSKLVVQ
jgi:hypothetical protein